MNGRVITGIEDARTRRCAEALMQHYPEDDRVGGIATFVRDVLTVMDAAREHERQSARSCPRCGGDAVSGPWGCDRCGWQPDRAALPPEAAEHIAIIRARVEDVREDRGSFHRSAECNRILAACDALESMVRRDGS